MSRLADRVKETTSTTGTAPKVLTGASAGFRSFVGALGPGGVYYAEVHQSLAEWECGIGTISASPDTITPSSILSSSNAGAATNFSAGLKDVFCTAPAIALGPKPAIPLWPEAATLPATNFPELKKRVGTNWIEYVLGFDTTTQEIGYWRFWIPSTAIFTAATLKVVSRQAAQTTGTVGWVFTSLARVDGNPWDATGFADTVTASTVKGTAGQLLIQSKALTITGWVPGAVIFAKLARDVANDTCSEDADLMSATVELT